jgi:hypothetical protein
MSQGQDAKLFQRGKIQVRNNSFVGPTSSLIRARNVAGISSRTARRGEQGQEVHEKKDGIEKNCGKYHDGQ